MLSKYRFHSKYQDISCSLNINDRYSISILKIYGFGFCMVLTIWSCLLLMRSFLLCWKLSACLGVKVATWALALVPVFPIKFYKCATGSIIIVMPSHLYLVELLRRRTFPLWWVFVIFCLFLYHWQNLYFEKSNCKIIWPIHAFTLLLFKIFAPILN